MGAELIGSLLMTRKGKGMDVTTSVRLQRGCGVHLGCSVVPVPLSDFHSQLPHHEAVQAATGEVHIMPAKRE